MRISTLPAHVADASSEERLSRAVARTARGWMRLGREEARALELTLPQVMLMHALNEVGPLPATRWAELVGSSPSASTGLLDGLEAAGYVRREHDRTDRRLVLVSLTASGRAVVRRLVAAHRRRWRSLCRGIPEGRLAAAAGTLDEIVERLEAHVPPDPIVRSRARSVSS
jgi:DNA-binding MarR family transcriptional regulator